jgi:hypothetical protein
LLFNPCGKLNSGARPFNAGVFLRLYELNLDLLPFLGVRYLITDVTLHDTRATLRAEQSYHDAPPILLYEIANPRRELKTATCACPPLRSLLASRARSSSHGGVSVKPCRINAICGIGVMLR